MERKDWILVAQTVKAWSIVTDGAIIAYNAGALNATNAWRFAWIASHDKVAGETALIYTEGAFPLGWFAADLTAADLYKTVYHLNGVLSFASATWAFPIGILTEIKSLRVWYVKIDNFVWSLVA